MSLLARTTTTGRDHVPAGIVAAAVAAAGLVLLPVLVVVAQAVTGEVSASVDFLLRPRVFELLRNTVGLLVVSGAGCLVLGVAAAWLVERTDLPLRPLWRALLIAPLAVPAFVNGYAWVSLRPATSGLAGAALVTTLSYFPFVVLPVAAALRGLDPALEESARSLGLRPAAVFTRVTLPQLRPAALGGLLLVTLHLLAEYGALELVRFPTFTVAILEQYDAAFAGVSAALLACVLVVLALTVLGGEAALRGRAGYARIGSGARRTTTTVRLRWWSPAALAALAGLAVLAVGVPVWALVRWLTAPTDPLLDEGSSTMPGVLDVTAATLGLAAAGAVVTVVLAFPVAWLVSRRRTPLARTVERVTYVASSLPGVVVGLALVTLTVRNVPWLYQSTPLLVLAYAILFLPRAVVAIRAAMVQAPPVLTETARSLGSGALATLVRVVVPLTLPGIVAGFALVFIATSTELTATLLLAPTGTETLATAFWQASNSLDYRSAAPYALVMVALSAPLTWLLGRRAAR